jgi:hypothetical protein
MADITMCTGNMCPQKNKCYRYKAEPTPLRQSFFSYPPMDEEGDCRYFWLWENEDGK